MGWKLPFKCFDCVSANKFGTWVKLCMRVSQVNAIYKMKRQHVSLVSCERKWKGSTEISFTLASSQLGGKSNVFCAIFRCFFFFLAICSGFILFAVVLCVDASIGFPKSKYQMVFLFAFLGECLKFLEHSYTSRHVYNLQSINAILGCVTLHLTQRRQKRSKMKKKK